MVLTHENILDTEECLRSLTALDYPRHSIVLVDNGSADVTVSLLRSRWQDKVLFIETGRNLGAAAGWNAGILACREQRVDFFLILNNDIIVEPGLIEALLGAFETYSDTALASPVIVEDGRPSRVWFAGGTYNRLFGYTRHPGMGKLWQSVAQRFGAYRVTNYAPFCAALISRKAFEAVGLFDDWFFFGHEDVDWCLRAAREGMRCLVVGKPLVRHKISASGGLRGSLAFTPFSAYHFAAGSMKLGRKQYRGLALGPFLIGQICLRLPVHFWRMARSGQFASMRPYFSGLLAGATARTGRDLDCDQGRF